MKNIIFDIGGVLANPKSGNWFITPNFYKIVNKNLINEELLLIKLKEFLYLHTQEPKKEIEEQQMFSHYYFEVLKSIDYPVTKEIADEIANDCVYNDDKFMFYDDVIPTLQYLSKYYNLYIISNGWPSSFRVLKNKNIIEYFKDVYISSMFSTIKEEKLFDIFLENHKEINPQESLYIDDRNHILKKAQEYSFNILMLRRENNFDEHLYNEITSLDELTKYLNQK